MRLNLKSPKLGSSVLAFCKFVGLFVPIIENGKELWIWLFFFHSKSSTINKNMNGSSDIY